jgi:hypothetical protein
MMKEMTKNTDTSEQKIKDIFLTLQSTLFVLRLQSGSAT